MIGVFFFGISYNLSYIYCVYQALHLKHKLFYLSVYEIVFSLFLHWASGVLGWRIRRDDDQAHCKPWLWSYWRNSPTLSKVNASSCLNVMLLWIGSPPWHRTYQQEAIPYFCMTMFLATKAVTKLLMAIVVWSLVMTVATFHICVTRMIDCEALR